MAEDKASMSVNGWNPEYLDELYTQWTADPESVEPQWRQFFQGFELGVGRPVADDVVDVAHTRQGKVDSLIYHYRDIGHLAAELDPLGTERPFPEHLTLESFGLSDADLEGSCDPGILPLPNPSPLSDIISLLEDTYCRHIGVEYMHIQDRQKRRWLQKRMETCRNRPALSNDQKLYILHQLIDADAFESFLDKRFKGKKRFGLDGGESLIPMIDQIVELGPANGVEEYTFGMAHRGRLNVLVNILNKTYDQIFTEFEEAWVEDYVEGGGDVKYHRGYSSDHLTSTGLNVRLTLAPNPSHLEFGHSVVLGRARSKQRLREDAARERCVPILMHGDAAFPGQGIVAECLNMMKLDGYTVGGALHVIINNQVGFTTNPGDAHSGQYCTDIAKMVEAPIFHVNGDDPEACAWAARLAVEYRQAFKNDVVIDMWCYRKYGHNEGDEPTFTQPLMYKRIRNQKTTLRKYAEQLVSEGVITDEDLHSTYEELTKRLDEAQTRSKEKPVDPTINPFSSSSVWSGLTESYTPTPVSTGVPIETLRTVSESLGRVPEGFEPHRKLKKLLDYRGTAIEKDVPLDWGLAEMLAYGTLLVQGSAVRLTGQDVERGTFSHRHAVLFDQNNGEGYTPLNHIEDDQARFCVHNSPLTESACVGFEYGYSLGDPNMLVAWEAQFGDFANGAQVIFDQFIASAEAKWERFSGITCLLPHGYEGQGPEHSSARLERFLQLCANKNMQVAYPTTPSQIFHLLRRQMVRPFRKPLIIMSPKSLLRHPKATSPVSSLLEGNFQRVIDDPAVSDRSSIRRVVLCSGKVYYDVVEQRDKAGHDDVAVIRVEQLYPFPAKRLTEALAPYDHVAEWIWLQEEPRNMGAWRYFSDRMREQFDIDLHYIGREANASPAVASMKMHQQEQQKLMIAAMGLPAGNGSKKKKKSAPKRKVKVAG